MSDIIRPMEFFDPIIDDMVPGVYEDRYMISSEGRVFDKNLIDLSKTY